MTHDIHEGIIVEDSNSNSVQPLFPTPLLLLAQEIEIITLIGNNWAMCEVREAFDSHALGDRCSLSLWKQLVSHTAARHVTGKSLLRNLRKQG